MANPLRGEVDMVAAGVSYRLRLTINEIIEVETLLDRGIIQIADMFNSLQTVKAGELRAVLWAALQVHHQGIDLHDAGNIMADAGIPLVVAKLAEAIQSAFPQAKDDKDPSPDRGTAGTGKRSSSTSRPSRRTPANSGR